MKHFITRCLSLLRSVVTKYHSLDGFKNRHLCPTVLEAEKSEDASMLGAAEDTLPVWQVSSHGTQREKEEASSLRTRALIPS